MGPRRRGPEPGRRRRDLRFRGEISYSTADYLKLLDSTSTYRLLDPAGRAKALGAVADIVESHGGVIHLALFTDVCLARRGQEA